MDYIERGLYRDLLDECWVEGSIPNDIEKLADICGCSIEVMANAWQKLSKCFQLLDNVFINERLENERTEKDAHRVKMALAGQQGGKQKSLNNNDVETDTSKSLANASKCHIEEKSRVKKSRVKKSREEERRDTSTADAVMSDRVTGVSIGVVFDYWRSVMNHPKAKLDRKREKAISGRLKDDYTQADLCAAIDGCKRSPWNMGQNPGATIYDDIELICRDATHVDKFIKLADLPDRSTMSDLHRRNVQAGELFLQKRQAQREAQNEAQ